MNGPPPEEPELPASKPSALILLALNVPLPLTLGPRFSCFTGVLLYILQMANGILWGRRGNLPQILSSG